MILPRNTFCPTCDDHVDPLPWGGVNGLIHYACNRCDSMTLYESKETYIEYLHVQVRSQYECTHTFRENEINDQVECVHCGLPEGCTP